MTGTFPPEHLISVLMCKHHCSHWHSQHICVRESEQVCRQLLHICNMLAIWMISRILYSQLVSNMSLHLLVCRYKYKKGTKCDFTLAHWSLLTTRRSFAPKEILFYERF